MKCAELQKMKCEMKIFEPKVLKNNVGRMIQPAPRIGG
jgi:hypothetical protein